MNKNNQDIFLKYHLRRTRPRLVIWQLLQANHHPQSARQIHAQIKKQFDLTSVYRNLFMFENLGVIQREHKLGEDYFYVASRKHHHITCTNCGRSECVPCEHEFIFKNFFNVKHSLTLVGVCAQCRHLV